MKKVLFNFFIEMLFITVVCVGFILADDNIEFSKAAVILFAVLGIMKHILNVFPKDDFSRLDILFDRLVSWTILVLLFVIFWVIGSKTLANLFDNLIVLALIWLSWLFRGLSKIFEYRYKHSKGKITN